MREMVNGLQSSKKDNDFMILKVEAMMGINEVNMLRSSLILDWFVSWV